MTPPQFTFLEASLGLRNSYTRIPFRYGASCLTACPQAIERVVIEVGGRQQVGFAGDCLPPGWFDKTPGRSFADQITDMCAVIGLARDSFAEHAARPIDFFSAWRAVWEDVQEKGAARGFNPLLASFGVSMVERGVIDALCRAKGLSLFEALRSDLLGVRPAEIHPQLTGHTVADWIADEPRRSLHVRHTVGLIDPLTDADVPGEERLADGLPQTFEQYVERTGIRYFKVKVSNRLESDVARLVAIAEIVERRRDRDYRLTLDGNEQYPSPAAFEPLVEALRSNGRLATLADNIIAIEQPIDRRASLDPAHAEGIARLNRFKPVIIDEADGPLDAYSQALELGYRGVSSKNCKGAVKSLLNAGLTWLMNGKRKIAAGEANDATSAERPRYLMTAEDLCTVGIVSVQSDLGLIAALGLDHVERNGHHYHRGLSYLPDEVQQAALAAHGDFYHAVELESDTLSKVARTVVAPRIDDGKFYIGSLQCPGYGFSVLPRAEDFTQADAWKFDSLGLG